MLRGVPYKWLVAIAFVFGLFMEVLDMTVLNTALPALGRQFGVGTESLQWLVTGYLVSMAVFIPASGWVADRFGSKRTFLFALAVFTAASLWAGVAGSLAELVTARIVQGVGGGLLTPVGTAMLFRAFPPEERAQASAILSIPTGIAPALGPVLGGWLVDNVDWRWIFLMKVPIGVAGIAFTAAVIREERTDHPGRFDVVGFLAGGGALALLLVGLDQGVLGEWSSASVFLPLIGGALLAVVFVIAELRIAEPMIDLRLLRIRLFRTGNLLMLPSSGALMGTLFLTPLLLQSLLGLDATGSGLVTMFQALGMTATMPFAGWLYQRLGPRWMLTAGFVAIAASVAALLPIGVDSSLWGVRVPMLTMGIGMALTVIALQAATFAQVSPAAMTRASSVFATTRQVAAAVGVALVASILTLRTDQRVGGLAPVVTEAVRQDAMLSAFRDTFLVALVVAVLGLLIALRVRDADAAASMRSAKPAGEAAGTAVGSGPEQLQARSGK
ncbi:drug resistance transporter, EmrB/QacA subfamily [Saccharopolyspora antimicrobica]|uniref:Drug resistance transporter, EmrB/QacA subfamily n=1 Tax=Saccharopolyspora antimicrobica TaxID=455193 RepID=A0A1I4RS94_9PSEU|nr:MDR family MFS transporter [Saccharopolyspora antimicrobica]RKT87898.1 EmrB/QacA subfamily drug resistance transporter [Saccharopolyspora antimicrobica]SFM55078.1 drug resistance transporter, EmrB/QacA subfamily [Saccharopolyspora antimicrobica]